MTPRTASCALALLLPAAGTGCRDATYVTLKLETDANCSELTATSVTVGSPSEMETLSATTTTKRCGSDGRIGSLVLVPSGDKDARFGVKVVAGVGMDPEDCVASNYLGGCIVARRVIRFVPHTALELPVALTLDCLDIPCGALETCSHGKCVPAEIATSQCLSPEGCILGTGGTGGTGGSTGGTGGSGGSTGGSGGTGGTGGSTGGTGGSTGGSGGTGGASCPAPSADCDGTPATCETNLDDSASHCGACGHACLGGVCQAGSCQPVSVSTGAGTSRYVAVDDTAVYWATYSAAGVIRRASLDGSGTPIDLVAQQPFVAALAVDATNLYWSTSENTGVVMKVAKTGGTPVQLATANKPNGFGVDATTAFFSESSGSGAMSSAPLSGSGPKTGLASSVAWPWAVALDATNVYFTSNSANGAVYSLPKGGGTPQKLADSKFPYSVAVDATNVYYAEVTGAFRAPITGGTPTKLGGASDSYAIALDATRAYWTQYYDGTVLMAPKSGGQATALATGQGSPWGIAVGSTAVCWANAAAGGAIMKVARPLP